MSYPSAKAKFGDEGRDPGQCNLAAFIHNDDGTDKKFEHFAPNHTKGFSNIGLARINQSIQAYCYSILGAQANSHMSIIGDSGSAKNTQLDFLILVEDAIKTLDASNGPVKYQNAIERTKMRLDFAIARGVLLMPSRMIINTESIVGYNNNLTRVTDDMKLGVNNHVNLETKKASLKPMAGGPSKINPPNSHPSNPRVTDDMKLGVNNHVNLETKKASLKPMAGGPSKINPPNSHPSNPIHKKATEAQGIAKKKPTQIQTKETDKPATQTPTTDTTTQAQTPATPTTTDSDDTHHINKALVGLGALALVGFVLWASK